MSLGLVLILLGMPFFLAGTLGLLRFPDLLSREHAVTKADNLGLGLVVLGLMLEADSLLLAIKLFLIWIAVLVASATVAQMIAQTVVGTEHSGTDGGT
jgi:multicomponent Na+:H+ antiporter subunit G